MENNELYNLPDIQFVKWCEKTFAINRGVYNTIDQKLFELGHRDIQKRRRVLIDFLQKNVESTERKYFKFGVGNLAEALEKI